MLLRQAKILTAKQAELLLIYASSTRHPQRDRLIVLLSVKAGLRAAEIAGLTWDMVQMAILPAALNCVITPPRKGQAAAR